MPEVCLTFDNGPEPDATPGVLDVLARRRVPAVFFPIGAKLRDAAARRCAERAWAEGHALGNHTLSHGAPLGRRGAAEAVAEIAEAEALLAPLRRPSPPADAAPSPAWGRAERLFRPNGGGGAIGPHLLNRAAAAHLVAGGYTVVLWTAVPGDFRDPEGWPGTALAMLDAATGTAVLVLHDLPNGAMRHLDRFLGAALDAGHGFGATPPEACLPIRRGTPSPGLPRYLAD